MLRIRHGPLDGGSSSGMGLVLREFSYFPLFEERSLLVRAAEYILVDWTNKSYGLSLGRYARRRDPIGIHEVHLAIVM